MYGFGGIEVLMGLLAIGGTMCGFVSLMRARRLARELEDLKRQVRSLREYLVRKGPFTPRPEEDLSLAPQPVHDNVLKEAIQAPAQRPPVSPGPHTSLKTEKNAPQLSKPSKAPPLSLEMKLGTRWLNWVGIVMLLVGLGFFLKYAYDNAWIGPKGRLAIGALLGIAALGLGERFRRRDWPILFQVLTGGGLATFYLCVFFSFQIYRLADQTMAMALAMIVTGLAVLMAVAHGAVSIAVLALIGGFLSPVLLSTGTNHPYALFTYIAILDMVAMGAAYFRRWRALDLLCFVSTAIMYFGWHKKFYAEDPMAPALVFTSLFYVMFLIIPTLYGLVRRLPETWEGVAIILLDAVLSFISFYNLLFWRYPYLLGFVVLGQALLVLMLFQVRTTRVGTDSEISASLLAIALGLVILAVPIQLKLYGIPIAWSVEGAAFVFLGVKSRQIICKGAGLLALLLAAGGLLARLPLHSLPFIPVFNVPFGSWLFVAVTAGSSAYLSYREKTAAKERAVLISIPFLLAVSLICFALSMEVSLFWAVRPRLPHSLAYEASSLIVLWALIGFVISTVLLKKDVKTLMPLSWVCYGIGTLILFAGLEHYSHSSQWLFLNAVFLPRLIFILSLWWGARLCRQLDLRQPADVHAVAGHAILAVLIALELSRWGHSSQLITPKMTTSLISAAWAVQAFLLIWIGLARRLPLLRYLGFVLFVLTIGKILIVDMSELEKVYRIISFAASGLLLVAAGYFYQRYASRVTQRSDSERRK